MQNTSFMQKMISNVLAFTGQQLWSIVGLLVQKCCTWFSARWVNACLTRRSQSKSCWNQPERSCLCTVLLCFCDSGLLHHLSQAWSVQQRGTCITWTWKWFSSEGIKLHADNFSPSLRCSESGSHLACNGCLTSGERRAAFLSARDRVGIQPWKWTSISEIRKGNRRAPLSLSSDARFACAVRFISAVCLKRVFAWVCAEIDVCLHSAACGNSDSRYS